MSRKITLSDFDKFCLVPFRRRECVGLFYNDGKYEEVATTYNAIQNNAWKYHEKHVDSLVFSPPDYDQIIRTSKKQEYDDNIILGMVAAGLSAIVYFFLRR